MSYALSYICKYFSKTIVHFFNCQLPNLHFVWRLFLVHFYLVLGKGESICVMFLHSLFMFLCMWMIWKVFLLLFLFVQELGLKELHIGYSLKTGIRHVLSVMMLLSYHLIVTHILSSSDGDLNLCDEILKTQLEVGQFNTLIITFILIINVVKSICWVKLSSILYYSICLNFLLLMFNQ